jgi:hypothetical protein
VSKEQDFDKLMAVIEEIDRPVRIALSRKLSQLK